MSKRYTGNFISGTPQVPTLTSNNGIFDIKDVYTATSNNAWQEPDGYYEIGKSLRFRGANSNYLSRSQAADGNRKAWTFSAWVKLGGDNGFYMCAGGGTGIGVDVERMQFNNSGNGWYWQRAIIQTSTTYQQDTNGRWRDPSAWYHIMCIWDSNNANQAERWRTFVNGVKQTRSYGDGAVSQGQNSLFNSTAAWKIGRQDDQTSSYGDCYMAEVNFIDGQVLDPTYFGYNDPVTNIWQPKPYTGTYGTYGFYLPFNEPAATSGTVNAVNLGRNFVGSNYLKYSQDGSQQGTTGTYIVERATQTANTTTAPDGTTTANTLTADTTASNTHRWYIQTSTNPPTGSTQTTSIYLKYNNCRYINIENWNGSTNQTQTFDLLNGVPMVGRAAVSATGFTYQYVGNGWYRVSVPLYAGYTTATPSLAIYLCDSSGNASWTGNGTSAVYWWGSQLNIGTTPDPYIKTTSSPIINDWTTNNFSVTAGVTYDSMVDSPTNIGTTATDTGGVVSGNYATLNPLDGTTNSSLSEGNLLWYCQNGVGNCYAKTSTFWGPGKWYMEVTVGNGGFGGIGDTGGIGCMVYDPAVTYSSRAIGYGSNDYAWRFDGYKANNGTTTAYGTAVNANNDVVMMAWDTSNNTMWVGKNGTWFGSGNPATATNPTWSDTTRTQLEYLFKPVVWSKHGGSGTLTNYVNFGQRPFSYTPPSGFKSLNTTNMQALGSSAVGNAGIAPHKWFNIANYGGTNANRNIDVGFQPDLVWIKSRSETRSHVLFDSARGFGGNLDQVTNTADLDGNTAATATYGYVSGVNSNGFSLANGTTNGSAVNTSNHSLVAWNWKQSPTSGFNIVTYTGTGSTRTITHNLGVAPKMIIIKNRSVGTDDWCVYHSSLGATYRLFLDTTGAQVNDPTGFMNSTAPTSSVFTVGTNSSVNNSGSNFVAYLFAEVPGFSKFGSYTANANADGPFIYTGFRPKFVIIKASGMIQEWIMNDATRSSAGGTNPINITMQPNSNGSESSANDIDYLSNGFKVRVSGSGVNYNSGQTYIYAAFAESPFVLNNRAR